MPIATRYLTDERIIIVQFQGMCTADEIDNVIMGEVTTFILEQTPHPVHIIFDVRELEWDFKQFMGYLAKAAHRRSNDIVPDNLIQHFVGNNTWLSNFRSWLNKNFNEYMNGFTSLDVALEHIRSQSNS